MEPEQLNSRYVFTRNIAAASSLVSLGVKLRPALPVTVTEDGGNRDTLFWFEGGNVEVAGVSLGAASWLWLLLCSWAEFTACKDLGAHPLDHPVAYLKAAAENRAVLLTGVKTAAGKPFRVVRQAGRTIVIGADVSESGRREILQRG